MVYRGFDVLLCIFFALWNVDHTPGVGQYLVLRNRFAFATKNLSVIKWGRGGKTAEHSL